MKKQFSMFCAIALMVGVVSQAEAAAEDLWDGHEIDAQINASASFPTNLNTAGGALNYDTITYGFGLDTDVRIWWHLYSGLDVGYGRLGIQAAAVANVNGVGETYTISFHDKIKYTLPWGNENWRVYGGFGVGPYIVRTSGIGANDTDVVFGLNFGGGVEYLLSDLLLVGPVYKTHVVFDPDDTFLLHNIGVQFGVRF